MHHLSALPSQLVFFFFLSFYFSFSPSPHSHRFYAYRRSRSVLNIVLPSHPPAILLLPVPPIMVFLIPKKSSSQSNKGQDSQCNVFSYASFYAVTRFSQYSASLLRIQGFRGRRFHTRPREPLSSCLNACSTRERDRREHAHGIITATDCYLAAAERAGDGRRQGGRGAAQSASDAGPRRPRQVEIWVSLSASKRIYSGID